MPTHSFTVIFEFFRDEGAEGFSVIIPALPEVITWGKDLEEARFNAREALQCHLGGLLKPGEPIPPDIEQRDLVHVETLPIAV